MQKFKDIRVVDTIVCKQNFEKGDILKKICIFDLESLTISLNDNLNSTKKGF